MLPPKPAGVVGDADHAEACEDFSCLARCRCRSRFLSAMPTAGKAGSNMLGGFQPTRSENEYF